MEEVRGRLGWKRLQLQLQSCAKDTKTTLKHSRICRQHQCLFVYDTDMHERNQITDDKAAAAAGFEGRAQIETEACQLICSSAETSCVCGLCLCSC